MPYKNLLKLFLSISLVIAEKYFSVNHHIMLSSPSSENSYFGFSVQLQTSDYNSRVIVGAPRSSEIEKKVVESGKIFSCSLDGECEHFRIDSGYDNGNESWSWLGFSVDADYSTSNRLLACAPKWINYFDHPSFKYKLNGKCYYWENVEDSTDFMELKPLTSPDLQTLSTTYHYIFGEAGFSSSFIEGSNYFVLSSVGLYNWTGGVIQYDTTKMHSGNNFVAYPKRNLQTYSYFGYSFAFGKFNSSDVNKIFYVSGAPRSNDLKGKVLLFEELTQNDNLIVRYVYPGQQFGEYFGASIAVADVNGDNIDDLIIGAPMHNEDNKYERGRIYLYITQKNEKGNLKVRKIDQKILGEESGNRFGTSISNLGDINNDGCEDIAVGAPYYKNHGAIYIYLGQKSSQLLLSQTIYAKDVDTNLRGFGYSLSKGLDIDQNFNNDLAVGSYLSGHTVILKTRPTINLKTTLTSNVSQIDTKTKSLQIEYCLIYTNRKVPDILVTIGLRTSNNKVVFENDVIFYSQKELLKENENKCKKIILNIKDNLRHPIKITMNINVDHKSGEFCKFCPIVERKEELKKELSLHFSYGCKDEICKPDLKLSTDFSDKQIIIGAQSEMHINFRIDNLGENAFGVKLFVQIYPPYLKGHIDGMSICTRNETTLIIECNFNEYLETNKKTDKIFNLNIEDLKLSDTQVIVNFTVSSNGQDSDLSNNNVEVKIPVTHVVAYNIITKSEPEQIKITKELTNVNFIHTYTIESKGQTELQYLDAYFLIPYKYNNKIIVTNILGCDSQEKIIPAKIDAADEQENINLNCLSTQIKTLECKKLKCRLKNDNEDYKKLKSTEIQLSFYVNVAEFLEESKTVYLFSSIETDSEYLKIIKHTKSDLIPTNVKAANVILYVCLGILIAVIILAIIGIITYQFGCFKKFKPPVENEEEKDLIENKTNLNTLRKENEHKDDKMSTANSLYDTNESLYENKNSFAENNSTQA